jgi:hypothetical protein
MKKLQKNLPVCALMLPTTQQASANVAGRAILAASEMKERAKSR